ncbi:MAG: hemolysin family protein [Chloroflexi bacterium]|nr:hemolysin family protein [Chloroflexota bacterium]
MDPDSWLEIGIVIVALLLAAFASISDTALKSISRAKLQRLIDDGVPRAEAVEGFLRRPLVLASTIIILNNVALIVAAGAATLFVLHNFGGGLAPAVGILATFAAVLLFSQVVPKLIAVHHPERATIVVARPLEVMAFILSPLIRLLGGLAIVLERLVGAKHVPEGPLVTEEELRILVSVGEEQGILEEDEREMIHGIFDMEDTTAREIMVPRIDIHGLEAGSSVLDAVDLIVEEGYSRIPVYEENIDNIVGVLYAKDLLKHLKDSKVDMPVRGLVRPAYFIPESKKIDELLHELQQRKVHIAIVVDEYGGTAGLVTIEDLLEEIVGEIQDEYDIEEAKIVDLGDGQAIFEATVTIDDVNDTLDLRLEADDFDTIGGLVYTRLGTMPKVGDEVNVDGVTICVLDVEGRRIKKVRVSRHSVNGDADDIGQKQSQAG